MPLITVSTPTPHEPFEVRASNLDGGEALYTIVCNPVVTQYVPAEHLTAVTAAIQAAVPSSTVTSRPE